MSRFRADRLKALMRERGVSQAALARTLHAGKRSVNFWVNGLSQPDEDHEDAIADYFKVSLDFLRGRTDLEKIAGSDLSADEQRLLNAFRSGDVRPVLDLIGLLMTGLKEKLAEREHVGTKERRRG